MPINSPYRNQNLSNIHSSNFPSGFPECPAHAGLQSICAGHAEHLVDSDYMVGMNSDAHVEGFFASGFHEVSFWKKISVSLYYDLE